MIELDRRAIALGFVINFILGLIAGLWASLLALVIVGVLAGYIAGYLAGGSIWNGASNGFVSGILGGLIVAGLLVIFGSLAALAGDIPGGFRTLFRGSVAIVSISALFAINNLVGGAIGSLVVTRSTG